MRVIVVGGGVFGVAAALELRRRDHDVDLFDAGPVPRPEASSTDISKAVRMDYGPDVLYTELAERCFPTWDAWNRAWERPPYHQDGFLLLTGAPMEPGGFEYESYTLLRSRGHGLDRLDGNRCVERFPEWRGGLYPDGYFNPRAGWAESSAVVARLAGEARAAGVAIHERNGMRELTESGSKVTGIVSADGERHAADAVIVAAGAWTPSLLPELAGAMWPVAQPVLHFRPAHPERFDGSRFPVWGADIANTGWYGFPATADGIVKVSNHGPGRRVEPDVPRDDVGPDVEPRFREFLRGALPGLADAPLVASKLCLYCDSWDGNFWIDRHPDRPGLLVAAGGSGHGFKFAPVIGGVIADCLEGRPEPALARFRWRSPRGRRTESARHLGDPPGAGTAGSE